MYIPLHLQLLLAGSFCKHIKAVSQKTGVNIYLQHPLSQTFGCFVDPYDIGTVYMSGEMEQIEVAKFYLRMLMDQKVKRSKLKISVLYIFSRRTLICSLFRTIICTS